MRIVLLGAPGSGKGTQARVLADRYGVQLIGVGEILREEVRRGTAVGAEIADDLARGDLVHDRLILDTIWPLVLQASADGGYVLDGFPRTLHQAEMAHSASERDGVSPDVVVYLDIDRPMLLERMLARAEERSDDVAAVMEHRLQIFEERTRPLVGFYEARGLLATVDARRDKDAITADIVAAVEARKRTS